MSKIAKISIEYFDSTQQILFDFDKSKGLEENIKLISSQTNLPESNVYGLKYIPTRTNEKIHYVTEKNMEKIKHSDCLKVAFSIKYIVKFIIQFIHENFNLDVRDIVFEDILKLSSDPAFIDELEESNFDETLIEVFINDRLSSQEQLAVLKTIVHMFSLNKIRTTAQNILGKAMDILRDPVTSNDELRYTLSLLQNILIGDTAIFSQWKEIILREVNIEDLITFMKRKTIIDDIGPQYCREVQYEVLLLLNTIIQKREHNKKEVIADIDRMRDNIYKYVIYERDLEKNMQHELCTLQTYLLSLYNDSLNSKFSLMDNDIVRHEEFELCPEDMRRITILMDVEEVYFKSNGHFSVENLTFKESVRNSVRVPAASLRSDGSSSRPSSEGDSLKPFLNDAGCNKSISVLAIEAIKHYRKFHPKDFYQSQIEEKLFQEGLFYSSECVVRMLSKILCVGHEPAVDNFSSLSDDKNIFYQPMVFRCQTRPFLLELFAKTMCLLSRTRHEMRACNKEDFSMVLNVLKKQVIIALKSKPHNFEMLNEEMSKTSFSVIIDEKSKLEEEKTKELISSHPCIAEIREMKIKENEAYIFQQRIRTLVKGEYFPKVTDKRLNCLIYVKLRENLRDLEIYDSGSKFISEHILREIIIIDDITHIVIGKNCQHMDLCKGTELPFSIISNHEEKIKFIAPDEKTASYWIDSLLLLTQKGSPEKLSNFYNDELNVLLDMDIRIHILELQNIRIPTQAPPVPQEPKTLPLPLFAVHDLPSQKPVPKTRKISEPRE